MKVLVIQSYISKREREEEVRNKLVKELHNGTGVVMIPNGFNLADVVEDPVDICFADLSSGNTYIKSDSTSDDLMKMANKLKEHCASVEVGEECIFSLTGKCDSCTSNCKIANDAAEYWMI